MKKLLFLFLVFISSQISAQKTTNKIYTHSQLFEMIANEKDSIFRLNDAFIKYEPKTDSKFSYVDQEDSFLFQSIDSIIIDKYVYFNNVHFEHQKEDEGQGLPYVVFKKDLSIDDATSLMFMNCTFLGEVYFDTSVSGNEEINYYDKTHPNYEADIGFFNCTFTSDIELNIGSIENASFIGFSIYNSKFISKETRIKVDIITNSIKETNIDENQFIGNGYLSLGVDNSMFTSIFKNNFGDYRVTFLKESFTEHQAYIIERNVFKNPLFIHINQFSINHVYRWNQWKGKVHSLAGYDSYIKHLLETGNESSYDELYLSDDVYNSYVTASKYELTTAYKFEMQLLGQFYDFYKLQHDSDYANDVYVEFKDLETKRYDYLHKSKPTFNSYFTWKINQFLNVFSAYGTKPSLSIIFSLYVILLFAFVYMLFPNSWESNKKNKLMHRLRFFTKYFRQDEGIKEIYEEERQSDLMTFKEFQKYMTTSKKEIPNYFIWLAKPIYYFSSYNYKVTTRVLKHTDFLKGRWVDLPKRRKITSSIVMGIWIVLLIIYDLMVKFFNALILSVNTFTTLGFGEIPIKGIPRYIAVIQGFIGWFMLTIFSVSLISQLLN